MCFDTFCGASSLEIGWEDVDLKNTEEVLTNLLTAAKSAIAITGKTCKAPDLQYWHLKLLEHCVMACIQKDIDSNPSKSSVRNFRTVWYPILEYLYHQSEVLRDI